MSEDECGSYRYDTSDGGPAFPVSGGPGGVTSKGMSLRVWLAAQAMQAIIAKYGVIACQLPRDRGAEKDEIHDAGEDRNELDDVIHAGTAVTAFQIADAMIAASKEPMP